MVYQVDYDHRSYERNLSNCVYKPENVRTSTGFEPVTSRYRCNALTNCAMKPLTLGAGHLSSNEPVKNGCEVIYEMFHICLLYTSPSPRDQRGSRMPSSA